MEITKILVPVDFSTCAAVAVAYAAELSRLLRATVQVLHVTHTEASSSNNGGGVEITTGRGNDAAKELERLVAAFRDEGYEIGSKLRLGRPVDEIIGEAADGDYDLIVMGTRGNRGLTRLLSGSTTEAVLRRSTCAVVALREGSHPCRTILDQVDTAPERGDDFRR